MTKAEKEAFEWIDGANGDCDKALENLLQLLASWYTELNSEELRHFATVVTYIVGEA